MNSIQAKLVSRIRRFAPQVDRVADANRPIMVRVTPGDIRKADKKDPSNCAMACSFRRAGFDAAIIHPTKAYLIKGTLAIRYHVPESVLREIVSFDRHADFKAGVYQLSAIYKTDKIGADTRPSNRGSGKNKKAISRPLVVHRTEGIR